MGGLARGLLVPLALIALLAAAPAAATADVVRTATAKRLKPGKRVVKFKLRGVRRSAIRRGRIRVGRRRARIKVRRLRRGLKRGVLRLRLSRRWARRARRHRARLRLVLKGSAGGGPGASGGPWIGFETGDFSEVDAFSTLAGTLAVTRARAYEGRHSAHAVHLGGGSGFQRVWKNVSWNSGADVWYGLALYVPDVSAYCYWNPIRWDNYRTYGELGDVGGLAIENGRFRVVQDLYNWSERVLIDGGPVPQERWVWVELHQRLSIIGGQALSELFVDGRRVGASTQANGTSRRIDTLRAGVVNVAGSCSRPSSVGFDRISIRGSPLGPG